jgi:hypothetical protein
MTRHRNCINTLSLIMSALVCCLATSVSAQGESVATPADSIDLTPVEIDPFGGPTLAAPADTIVTSAVFPASRPSFTDRTPLPPIPSRVFDNLRTPPLPPGSRADSIVVDQIATEGIADPELRARADSLNEAIRRYAIQERLVDAQARGNSPRTGIINRKEYLGARVGLLGSIEDDLKEHLQRRVTGLTDRIDTLDSTITATQSQEILSLEEFIADNPGSRQIADAKFIVGQLYYEREQQRFVEAMLRFQSEFQRWRLGLIPVMPRRPSMNEGVAVPMYRDVVRLGTNEQLIPYSLYSLGKFHLGVSVDLAAHATDLRYEGDKAGSNIAREQKKAQSDTAKFYFARLVSEYPNDSVNVPEAYYVLATHYNVLGGLANRDTSAIYAEAVLRDHWSSPRFQAALSVLAEISFSNALALTFGDPERSKKSFSDAVAYLAWQAHEIDSFQAEQIAGVSPDAPLTMNTGRRDRAIGFMTQIITRQSPLPSVVVPPPVETTMNVVNATHRAPFGAELLRLVGDALNDRYGDSQDEKDLVTALTAYDSLLALYPTYDQGPSIQRKIIDNATYLSNDPAERINIYLRQKISYFERFNRDSEWARSADVSPLEMKAVDDSAASYLEKAAQYLYATARNSNDAAGLREALDYFVTYFKTYPDRPQAYELNWSVATELRDLGDLERAFDEFMRVSRQYEMDKYRQDAAVEAVAAAQQLVQQETQNAPEPPQTQGQ